MTLSFLLSFGGNPLDDETHGEHQLADKTEDQPEIKLEFRVSVRQITEKIGHDAHNGKVFHFKPFLQSHNRWDDASSTSQPGGR